MIPDTSDAVGDPFATGDQSGYIENKSVYLKAKMRSMIFLCQNRVLAQVLAPLAETYYRPSQKSICCSNPA
jgi:hypothetical protein